MNIYIWDDIDNLTSSYHSNGGLVVVAGSLERAVKLAINEGVYFSEFELISAKEATCGFTEEKVYIFPNAGCC